MLHAQLRRISPRARSSLSWAGSPKRTFGSYNSGEALARVPVLRPTLWALGAISTIYFGCAAYDVCRDVWDAKRQGAFSEGRVGTYEELEYTKLRSDGRHFASRTSSSSSSRSSSSKWLPTGQLGEMFAKFNESEKLILGVSALNIGLTGASYFAPGSFMQHFSHIPVYSPNYTLLTSAFGHSGLLHVALNTFMLIQLAPNVAQSHVFQANGSHLAAFYLSAGILSSLGDHLATLLPTRKYRYNRFAASLGSSGVAFASKSSPESFLPLFGLSRELAFPTFNFPFQLLSISVSYLPIYTPCDSCILE